MRMRWTLLKPTTEYPESHFLRIQLEVERALERLDPVTLFPRIVGHVSRSRSDTQSLGRVDFSIIVQ